MLRHKSRTHNGWGGGDGWLPHIVSTDGRRLAEGSGGILPQNSFTFGGYKTLFSALVMRYVSEKLTSNMKMANNCKSLQSK